MACCLLDGRIEPEAMSICCNGESEHGVSRSRYRLIVMDLDGTLLNEKGQIGAKTRTALQHAHEAGIHIAIATGRSFTLTRYFCGDLPLSGPQITYNGAIIVDPVSSQPIFLQAVPEHLVHPVVKFLQDQGVYVCYFTEQDIYVREQAPLAVALVPPGQPPPIIAPDLEALLHLPCLKIVAVADPSRIEALRPVAERRFGDQLYVTQTASVLLEFLHPSVSKGAALSRVMVDQGLDPSEVIAFGDSHNDLEMLQVAGTGVAMGNASEEVQAVASIVAPSNREDGIAVVLEKMLWE